ncbi:TRAP-type C4-dicarboxylate transport system, substrate-binding protein [Blastococcus mobilis]|uniref:TRAP-type C4-dicarboxylate transport system, substrate-binding protein n=1 Tax=Blastococcus mobilis TaxID=1938746 RepID=A0A238ZCP6_9ACTN|nr:TRAP-type C4-dicarboxylate transport system, substrate-binding protein [Blastococcus mobilis]
MRTRKPVGLIAATSLGLLAACGSDGSDSGSGSGSEVQLTVSSFLTEDHPASRGFEAWMEEVTERTDGAVTFETFYNGSLCGAADSIACAEDRTADIVMSVPAYNPEMTLANIGSVAFQTSDLQANQDALNKLYQDNEDYRAEYENRGLTMLYTFNNSMPVLASVEPVSSLDQIAGMSLRASGSMSTGIAALGANPVAIDPAEIYESLERGVVDGATFPLESVVDYRLTEVAPHVYDLGEYMGSYAMNAYTMNLDAFESLSEDQQAVVREVSEEIAGSYVEEFLVPTMEENCSALAETGTTVERLGPDEVGQAWAERAGDAQRAAWEESAAELTDAPAMFDAYLSNIEEASTGEAPTTAEICAGV